MAGMYRCYRCGGKGVIRGFSHVMGGICFKCGGSGTQVSKPCTILKWAVLGKDPLGNEVHCYNINAKTAKEAVNKAQNTAIKASTEWKNEHSLASAVAVPFDEYWTEERVASVQGADEKEIK